MGSISGQSEGTWEHQLCPTLARQPWPGFRRGKSSGIGEHNVYVAQRAGGTFGNTALMPVKDLLIALLPTGDLIFWLGPGPSIPPRVSPSDESAHGSRPSTVLLIMHASDSKG